MWLALRSGLAKRKRRVVSLACGPSDNPLARDTPLLLLWEAVACGSHLTPRSTASAVASSDVLCSSSKSVAHIRRACPPADVFSMAEVLSGVAQELLAVITCDSPRTHLVVPGGRPALGAWRMANTHLNHFISSQSGGDWSLRFWPHAESRLDFSISAGESPSPLLCGQCLASGQHPHLCPVILDLVICSAGEDLSLRARA